MSDESFNQSGFTPVESTPQAKEPESAVSPPRSAGKHQLDSTGFANRRTQLAGVFRNRFKETLALLALATGIIGIDLLDIYDVFRKDSPQPASTAGVTTLSKVQLEKRGILIKDEFGIEKEGLGISYAVEFPGDGNAEVYIFYALMDAVTMEQVIPPPRSGASFVLYTAVEQVRPDDAGTHEITVPLPAGRQCVFARVYAFRDEDGEERIAHEDSKPFDTHSQGNERCDELGVSADTS